MRPVSTRLAHCVCLIALINLSFAAPAQTTSPPAPLSFSASGLPMLAEGTVVKLRTTSPLSSSDARVGQSVEFEVTEEVRVGNIIVIPKDSAAFATVTAAQSKHSSAKTGKLEVSIDYVRLANGDKAVLRAGATASAHNAPTATETPSKIVFNPVSTSGKDVTIARGTEVSAQINTSVPVDPRKFLQVGGAMIPVPESVTTEGVTELTIGSNPGGAEITVDDQLVGLTPLRVIVRRGDHVVALRLAGYSTWVRSVQAAGGKMNVTAALDKGDNGEITYDSSNPLETCTLAKGCPQSSLAAASRAARARRSQQQSGSSQGSDPQQ
jgi:PEGA domain